jgi:hypothetical protein
LPSFATLHVSAFALNNVNALAVVPFPVPTRVPVTGVVLAAPTYYSFSAASGVAVATGLVYGGASSLTSANLFMTTTGLTAGQGGAFFNNTASSLYFTGAEL